MRILVTGHRGNAGARLAAVKRAADGCGAVVHSGALAHDTAGSPEDIMAINVLGTWHVLLAAEGAGVSRVGSFSSVETNARRHESVTLQLKERGVDNVDYILVPEDQPSENGDGPYAQVALTFPDASLDFALVDGYYRDYTAKYIMPKVKPGGLLIIDNINWHLPCQSKAPGTRPASSARPPAPGPRSGRRLLPGARSGRATACGTRPSSSGLRTEQVPHPLVRAPLAIMDSRVSAS